MADKYLTPLHEAADQLLAGIAAAAAELERTGALAAAALLEVERHWNRQLAPLRERLEGLAAGLRDLEKKHKGIFFKEMVRSAHPTSGTLALPHGALIYARSENVVKGRQVLRLAQLYGFEEVLRRTVAVDWEALADREEWPEAALDLLGTRRKSEERFDYELKNENGRQENLNKAKEAFDRR